LRFLFPVPNPSPQAPKLLAGLLLVLSLLTVAAPAALAQTITTAAPHALAMDFDSQTVLFEKGADDPVAPASVSKLMTAELVFRDLKKGSITFDTPFSISDHAWKTGSNGTNMFARVNTNIRVEDLLRGLIVQSGNDASVALAEGIGGSEENFAAMMNVRAGELGMTRSHFTDSWGGDNPAQVVTARDLAILAQHIIRTYPEYYHFFAEKEFTWSKIRQLNRNPMLLEAAAAPGGPPLPVFDGLKVGNLPEHGFNLVGSGTFNGQRLIVVVLDAKSAAERLSETRRLFNWGFRGFDIRTLYAAGETVGGAKVYGGDKAEVSLVSESPVKLMTPRSSGDKLSGKIVYTGPLVAPVAEGQTVARLKIFRGTSLALDVPLKTGEAVEQGPLTQRARDAAVELGLQLFHKGMDSALRRTPKKADAQASAP
jgi:D-alanyl-D-alanine carboxypeptidase (penicillin-binding protein 5/6)